MLDTYIMQIILLAICGFEVWLCLAFVHEIVPEAVVNKRKSIILQLIFGGFTMHMLFSNRKLLFFSDFVWLIVIASLCICMLFCAKKQKLLVVEIIVLYCSIVVLLDFFFAFLSMGVLQDLFWTKVYYRTLTWWSILIFLCTRMAAFLFWLWIRKKPIKGLDISRFRKLLLPVCGLLGILVRFFRILMVHIAKGTYEMQGWSVGIALSAFLVLLFILTTVMYRSGLLQDENTILRIQDETQRSRYAQLERQSEENNKIIHDVKHHVMALQGLCENGDMQSVAQYLSDMGGVLRKDVKRIWTKNKVLDLVLNQKMNEAESQGIVFDVSNNGFHDIVLSEGNIVSLFGNLLDNAIEACQRMKNDNKYIFINLEQRSNILHISILNSIDEKPIIRNNSIISSKRDGNTYGYGLKNVRRIVEQHDGVMSITADDHIFRICITLYI